MDAYLRILRQFTAWVVERPGHGRSGALSMTTFANEGSGKVFCLCEAPSQEAAEAVHREAYGEVADEITEVKEGA